MLLMNNNDTYMDLLSILSIVLQLEIMEEQKYQSDNDDIMEELQKQNKLYLEQIIKNQKLIDEKLNKLIHQD